MQLVIEKLEPGYCSVITEAELWAGIRNRREEIRIAALLSNFQVIPLTTSVARSTGRLMRGKSSGEIKAHFADAMIAASAIEVNQTILIADGRSNRLLKNPDFAKNNWSSRYENWDDFGLFTPFSAAC